ncbi:MAG: ParA family protein [Alphaproteobacteria bacterium]|nr:ParA family protein [Alphaproteobacteria bacterium]MBU0798667.1 ParA family protein [Alphaproteobacteria bacterium]MBU0885930.1 ParA family protein [Alphaproteobacteria bacterium]MBU1811919.1 ParA family protein [Alphaproteobacteria bacterium]
MSGKVITIAQQKGGAGKTTLAAHLAVAWASAGRSVVVLDIDPQASLTGWAEIRKALPTAPEMPDIRAITGWRVASEVDKLKKDFDVVLIDSPPHAETEARVAIRVADLVVVPIQPSPMDLWATQATLDLAKQEKSAILLVLNRMPPRARLAEAMEAAIGKLGVKVAKSTLGNRVALASALLEGRGITEAAPSSIAGKEIAALAKEVHKAAKG